MHQSASTVVSATVQGVRWVSIWSTSRLMQECGLDLRHGRERTVQGVWGLNLEHGRTLVQGVGLESASTVSALSVQGVRWVNCSTVVNAARSGGSICEHGRHAITARSAVGSNLRARSSALGARRRWSQICEHGRGAIAASVARRRPNRVSSISIKHRSVRFDSPHRRGSRPPPPAAAASRAEHRLAPPERGELRSRRPRRDVNLPLRKRGKVRSCSGDFRPLVAVAVPRRRKHSRRDVAPRPQGLTTRLGTLRDADGRQPVAADGTRHRPEVIEFGGDPPRKLSIRAHEHQVVEVRAKLVKLRSHLAGVRVRIVCCVVHRTVRARVTVRRAETSQEEQAGGVCVRQKPERSDQHLHALRVRSPPRVVLRRHDEHRHAGVTHERRVRVLVRAAGRAPPPRRRRRRPSRFSERAARQPAPPRG